MHHYICNIQFTIGVLKHQTPKRTTICVQYELNNMIFVLNDENVHLRIIKLDLADRERSSYHVAP